MFFEENKTTNEIAALIRGADGFFMFSNYENLPVVIIEALASGLPVLVSTNVNLATEIESAEAGWVAKLEPAAIEEALKIALSSADERGRRGRNGLCLARRFDWSLIGEHLAQLYCQVANKSQNRNAVASGRRS